MTFAAVLMSKYFTLEYGKAQVKERLATTSHIILYMITRITYFFGFEKLALGLKGGLIIYKVLYVSSSPAWLTTYDYYKLLQIEYW